MKPLVALACAAIILTVGYFFYGEYSGYSFAQKLAKASELDECERIVVAFNDFAKGNGEVEFGGAPKFQSMAAKCAAILKSDRGISLLVSEDGATVIP